MMTQKLKNFKCSLCDYLTSNKTQFTIHLSKHTSQNDDNDDKNDDKNDDAPKKPKNHVCECGKKYKYRQGLFCHKKKCALTINPTENTSQTENDIKILTNLVLNIVKQNQELTNKMVDICKNKLTSNYTTISNSNINSNNTTFNLHFFLNETCKNAMNITDFVDSLQLQISDLENVGKLGYVEGISNIIVQNLNALDETTRPIHCTDKKRETFYIKDENKWEKEDEEKNKIKKVIHKIAYKNQRLLPKFKELHPGCNFSDSNYSDHYSKLVIEAMGGLGNNEHEQDHKIIKNIAKEVTISKPNTTVLNS
jgi:hypothetical protein